MNAILLLALAVFALVLVHALVLTAWRSAIERRHGPSIAGAVPDQAPMLTMLVPARNAAGTLAPLLQDLHAQRYPRERMEVIVIDDHSEDRTTAIVEAMCGRWPQLRLLRLKETEGKKAALTAGVEYASGEWIVLTDADARCGPERIPRLVEACSCTPAEMILLPVITRGSGLLGILQEEEQFAFQAATTGSAMHDAPLLANGANLAFTKAAFNRINGFVGDRFASGDDQFLLQRMKRAGLRIGHLNHPDPAVEVEAETTWSGFFSQRLRWAGKMRAAAGAASLAGAFVVLLPWALAVFTAYAIAHFEPGQGIERTGLLILASWALWSLPIVSLVNAQKRAMRVRPRPLRTWLAALCFVVYALPIALAALMIRPRWKGRGIVR